MNLAESLNSRVAGIPAWLLALAIGGGLYLFAHYRTKPDTNPLPLDLIQGAGPAGPPSPVAQVFTYVPGAPPAGTPFGGSNPFSGSDTGLTMLPLGDANGGQQMVYPRDRGFISA